MNFDKESKFEKKKDFFSEGGRAGDVHIYIFYFIFYFHIYIHKQIETDIH